MVLLLSIPLMAAVSGPQADVLQPSLVFCQPAGIRDNARLNEGGISVNLDLEGIVLVVSLLFLWLSRIKRFQVMSMVRFGSTALNFGCFFGLEQHCDNNCF